MARKAGRRPASGRGYRPTRFRRYGPARSLLRRIGIPLALVVAVLGVRQHAVFYPVAMPYDRALYRHWTDSDGDCRDTRHETLAAQSLVPVRWSPDGCRVDDGRWYDPWSGVTVADPGAIDLDHVIPLAEAHRSGADAWSSARREAFANDAGGGQLVAVSASTNRSKADGDPLSWMPSRLSAWCTYITLWRGVKQRWALDADLLERAWAGGIAWTCERLSGTRGAVSAASAARR